ncbi:hypothetical protein WJX72_010670 [[Myrmecia] bisecta]|uniref:CW-type domain-containing protein n=1 Tax=[Myrmecia] bisecta TaxID=41462 RepID=A0AAW1Q1R9_9CHLO
MQPQQQPASAKKPKVAGTSAREVWEQCQSCHTWLPLDSQSGSARCNCGALVQYDAECNNKGQVDWVQCDSCSKWREVDGQQLAAIEAAGEGAEWQCSMLFPGAGCRMADDWLLEQMRERRREQKAAMQKLQAERREAEQKVKAEALVKRQWRARQREAGISAVDRYAEAQGDALRVVQEAGLIVEEAGATSAAARDPSYTSGPPHKKHKARHASPADDPEDENPDRDRWEECEKCGLWVNLGKGAGAISGPCEGCGETVTWQRHADLQNWVHCDACGKWRTVSSAMLREIEEAGDDAKWTCAQMKAGATCRTSANDWGAVVRRMAAQKQREERATASPVQLAQRWASAGDVTATTMQLELKPMPVAHMAEFVAGRDTLVPAGQLAAGLDAFQSGSGEHVLWAVGLPAAVLPLASPLVLRAMQLFQEGQLPVCMDGRLSAGPVDLPTFLAQAWVQEAVKQALQRRKTRLEAAGQLVAKERQMLCHVIHVSPDQRKVYIGDEHDVTGNGGSIMGFCKSWKSNPIRSWSGGKKMADMPGSQPSKLVSSKLSTLLAAEEPCFAEAANLIWGLLEGHAATAGAAARMMRYIQSSPLRTASQLGTSGWNAYSFNVDYRTGRHIDGKNTPGSYSALVICETGPAFCGCYYMLPQYHLALDVRQGHVLFHRSGDAEIGTHGNSGIWNPSPQSHRIALVFYQTELKDSKAAKKEEGDQEPVASLAQDRPDDCPWGPGREEPAGRLLPATNVIQVMDSNSHLCWETVYIDPYTNLTLLAWVYNLRDPLTAHPSLPEGQYLQIEHMVGPLPEIPLEIETYHQLIGDAWATGKTSFQLPTMLIMAFQLTMTPPVQTSDGRSTPAPRPDQVHATARHVFWNVVEMAGAYDTAIVAGAHPYGGTAEQDAVRLTLPANAVVILPRITALLGGVAPVTPKYANPHAWNRATVADMVERFLKVTAASSIPSVEEWSLLSDKVKLQRMYEEYYEADTDHCTPPIPTVEVAVPGSPGELLQLCYSEDYDSPLRKVFVADESDPSLRHYVVKRQFSEGSAHIISITFPGPALAAGHSVPSPTPGSESPSRPWRLRQPLLLHGNSSARMELAGSNVARPMYLMDAARFIARESCGEGWLLQPKIAGMESLEYRVHLVGGADAQGTAGDTLVVYTPAVLQDRGIAMANLTIPEGYFWSDAIDPPDGSNVGMTGVAEKLYQARTPWKSPELYGLVVKAALDAAQAMASSARWGHALPSVSHVFARADVILAAYFEDGVRVPVPIVNEPVACLNSASKLLPAWNAAFPLSGLTTDVPASEAGIRGTFGCRSLILHTTCPAEGPVQQICRHLPSLHELVLTMDPYYDGPLDEELSAKDITMLVSDHFASLSRLTELTKLELDLSAPDTGGVGMEWQGPFPEPLCSLTRLQTLKVIGNGIPTSFSQLAALRDLNLTDCGTTHLPTRGLAHLTSLCIKEPEYGFLLPAEHQMAAMLGNAPQLKHLNLWFNGIQLRAEDVLLLTQTLGNLQQLSLMLTTSQLDARSLQCLSEIEASFRDDPFTPISRQKRTFKGVRHHMGYSYS